MEQQELQNLHELQSKIQGEVIVPGDAGYDAARMGFNLSLPQKPAVVVCVQSADDVLQAINFAREHGLGVAVQATGHGMVYPANDSLLINTSQMSAVRVDANAQMAWVEAGTRWGKVLEAAQAEGLAPLLGSSPTVGAVGYTLGGGIGWLSRKYGLSCDSALNFEVITADGRLLHANEQENPDLFWGLRGGGGSLGVVTAMMIKLYPVIMVYGGFLVFPFAAAREVYDRYRDWIAEAPQELTSSIALMHLPPLPELPEFLRGQSVTMVRGCYVGTMEDGEALFQTWRTPLPSGTTPIADMVVPLPFSQVAMISSDPPNPVPSLGSSLSLQSISDEVIDILIRGVNPQSGILQVEIRHVEGALAQGDSQAAAFGHRHAAYIMHFVGVTPTPEAYQGLGQTITQLKDELAPYQAMGIYLNFLEGEEKGARTADAFSAESYGRLRELKGKYDPNNLFRYSFPIPPN